MPRVLVIFLWLSCCGAAMGFNCLCNVPQDNFFLRVVLYEGRNCSGNEPVPYQTSRNYKSWEQDKMSVIELRNWLARNKIEDLVGLSPAMTFEHIKKICHVSEVESESMLFLWDGTDTPPAAVEAKSYDKRMPSKWGRMPLTSFSGQSYVTATDYLDVPFVALMSVLTHPEVTYKFKCVVRVVAILPWNPEGFCAANGLYRLRLTLEDPTARIHASLYAEDGDVSDICHNNGGLIPADSDCNTFVQILC